VKESEPPFPERWGPLKGNAEERMRNDKMEGEETELEKIRMMEKESSRKRSEHQGDPGVLGGPHDGWKDPGRGIPGEDICRPLQQFPSGDEGCGFFQDHLHAGGEVWDGNGARGKGRGRREETWIQFLKVGGDGEEEIGLKMISEKGEAACKKFPLKKVEIFLEDCFQKPADIL
jgi:hypothetical protein